MRQDSVSDEYSIKLEELCCKFSDEFHIQAQLRDGFNRQLEGLKENELIIYKGLLRQIMSYFMDPRTQEFIRNHNKRHGDVVIITTKFCEILREQPNMFHQTLDTLDLYKTGIAQAGVASELVQSVSKQTEYQKALQRLSAPERVKTVNSSYSQKN